MSPSEVIFSLEQNTVDRYTYYWQKIEALNHEEFFKRFLFAFMSVHTTWRSNVSGYEAIKNRDEWKDDRAILLGQLKAGKCGLYNNRARYIWDFHLQFWSKPDWFYRRQDEPWWAYRDRLEDQIVGLGPAKTSFALEMAFPLECEVVCLDVHMLRLFGYDQSKVDRQLYAGLEHRWLSHCKERNIASYPARMVYWDSLQKRNDSRYWSYVFEPQSQAVCTPPPSPLP